MTSVAGLAQLFCANCQDQTLHRGRGCIHCSTPNTSSGNPPVPRPKSQGIRSPAGEARRVEALRASHAARRARKEALARGHT